MNQEDVAEIGIDDQQRLYVVPASTSFNYIYRSAMGVHWEPDRKRLYSPKPRDWGYEHWFAQIKAAALGEYGIALQLTSETQWNDVPEAIRTAIQSSI